MAWTATLNGTVLKASPDRSEPYGAPYDPLTGAAEQHRAWSVPPELLKDGPNAFAVTLNGPVKSPCLLAIDFILE